jgi:hypothetical protein
MGYMKYPVAGNEKSQWDAMKYPVARNEKIQWQGISGML